MIGESFPYDWLRGWHEFSGPIRDKSTAEPLQSWITFDTSLETSLSLLPSVVLTMFSVITLLKCGPSRPFLTSK